MPEKMSHAVLVQAMERRFDFQSARNILGAVLHELDLGEKPEYEQTEIERIGSSLRASYGADRVVQALQSFFLPEPEAIRVPAAPPVAPIVAPKAPAAPASPVVEAAPVEAAAAPVEPAATPAEPAEPVAVEAEKVEAEEVEEVKEGKAEKKKKK